MTIAGELIEKHKCPEKSSPGPARYDNHSAKLKNLTRTPGNYLVKEERVTFVDAAQRLEKIEHQDLGKYNPCDPLKYKYPS